MNLNTIPGIVKAIIELRNDVDILKKLKTEKPVSQQPTMAGLRGRPRKVDPVVPVEPVPETPNEGVVL